MTSQPRPNPVPTPSLAVFSTFEPNPVAPHDSTPSPRPPYIRGRGRGRGGNPVPNPSLSKRFTANTCPACGAITIAGLLLGIRVDLEPHTLTDLEEYQAIRDGVTTWDYRHDATITDRGVAEIRGPSRHDRHARHVCGTTYGTQPRTRTVTRKPIDHAEPPF